MPIKKFRSLDDIRKALRVEPGTLEHSYALLGWQTGSPQNSNFLPGSTNIVPLKRLGLNEPPGNSLVDSWFWNIRRMNQRPLTLKPRGAPDRWSG